MVAGPSPANEKTSLRPANGTALPPKTGPRVPPKPQARATESQPNYLYVGTKRLGAGQFKVKSVRIDTEVVEAEGGSPRNVSAIEIVISKATEQQAAPSGNALRRKTGNLAKEK